MDIAHVHVRDTCRNSPMISICPSVRLSPYNSALYLGGGKGGTGVPEQFRVNLGRRTPQRTDRLRRYQHHVRMYVTMIYSTLYVLAQSFSASFLVRLWLSGIDRCRTSSFFFTKERNVFKSVLFQSGGYLFALAQCRSPAAAAAAAAAATATAAQLWQ